MMYRNTRESHFAIGICLLLQAAFGSVFAAHSANGSAIATLPPPTGPFAVGKVTVNWTDESRIEPLSSTLEPRELMVDIWYPAEPSNGPLAPYMNTVAYQEALGADDFRQQFGDSSEAITAGVRANAVAGAPYAHSAKQSPVLIFSPGGGMVREVYATQFSDLASYGYVVAAISHTYDAIVTIFPDGKQVRYSAQRWPVVPSFEGEANLNQLEWHTQDIRFVLDELSRKNSAGSPGLPFNGHINLGQVGAFGHSFGGMAAAHACQTDRRFKACLDEDGVVGKRPYHLDPRGWGMDQAFMLILRDAPRHRLSDKEVAGMRMSRERVEDLIRRLDEDQEAALRRTGAGGYRVRLQHDLTTHMDFTDLPLLASRDTASAERRTAILSVVSSYTLAFFDKYLRGMKAPLLQPAAAGGLVQTVEVFPAAKTPCRPQ
jgi:hypothetical protein